VIAHFVAFGAGLQTSSCIRQFLAIARITVVNRTLNTRLTSLLGDLWRGYPCASLVALSSSVDDDDDDERRALIKAAVRQADCICSALRESTRPVRTL